MLRVFSAGLALLAATAGVQAQDLQTQVESWRTRTDVLGISVAVWDGRSLDTAVAGHRSENGEAITPSDRFAIASVSKTFTAAAILALNADHLVSLDDAAATASGLNFGANLTVRSLLYHTAGIPEYIGGALSFQTFLAEHSNGRSSWLSETVVGFATAAPGTANSDFAYSNSHYAVLGRVIEHQTGLDLADALDNLVFQPAGLSSASLVTDSSDAPDALGYSAMLGGVLGAPQFDDRLARELASLGYAAGGVMINAGDLARWGAIWLADDTGATGQAYQLPAGGEAFGLDAGRVSVGAGAFEVLYGDHRYRLHGGDGLGATALVFYDPETGISVAILQNDDTVRSLGFGAPGFLDELALEILASRAR
ncbi:serine hydrolase domain-containing protein [Maricaulis sp.]|uniref:serine hydrolase domain-containing protein n=1 Tax=Maricaulis sp. TaxID=1486257 RepID=UPI0025BB9A92|nr:serine hydrolase domain-containing protein [Maricaulis sp.]